MKIVNVIVRLLGMFGKFLLLLMMAKYLPLSELGVYGLLTATVSYLIYLSGFDFYNYAHRNISGIDKAKWGGLIKDHGVLVFLGYLFSAVLVGLVAGYIQSVREYYLILCVLLFVEVLSQELMRLLVLTGKPNVAGINLFIRSGAWCYPLIVIWVFDPQGVCLITIFYFWIAFDLVAILLSLYLIDRKIFTGFFSKFSEKWVLSGLKTSLLILSGTLALRGLFTVDRYILEIVAPVDLLGVYTLYIGLAVVLINLLDASHISYWFPKLLKAGAENHLNNCLVFKEFLGYGVFLAIGFASAIGAGGWVIFEYIGKVELIENYTAYLVIVLSIAVYGIGYCIQYILYSLHHDVANVVSNLFALVVFAISAYYLTLSTGLNGLAVSLLVAMIAYLIAKLFLARKFLF